MFLFDRKFKSLEEKVERLEGRLSGVNNDLRALEDAACFKRDWNYLIWFVLSEARLSDSWDGFVIPIKRNVRISVGELKKLISDAGYDFSKLRLTKSNDVVGVLRRISRGDCLGVFVDEDVLKVEKVDG